MRMFVPDYEHDYPSQHLPWNATLVGLHPLHHQKTTKEKGGDERHVEVRCSEQHRQNTEEGGLGLAARRADHAARLRKSSLHKKDRRGSCEQSAQ